MQWLGFDTDTPPHTRRRVLVVLVVALLGISSSAVIVKSMAAPALAIAAWRTLGSAALLSPSYRGGVGRVGPAEWRGIAIAGVALALHFWAWFASLEQTTVLRSTLLVCLVPVWTSLFEWITEGARPRATHWLGLAIALPGLGLLASTGGTATWTGDALAVGAGWLWAIYLLVGRRVRRTVPIAPYMGLVCGAAALLLFPLAGVTGTALWGWPASTWGLLVLAILGPQLLGHQGFNYAVRWVPATTISTIMLLEPVGASLLAAAILGEVPGAWAFVGGGLVLVGIAVATRPAPGSLDEQGR